VEFLLRWLDDLDDLCGVLWRYSPQFVTTLALAIAFATSVGVILLFGPPELLAAP
jgi:hypothetical protein